MSTVNEKMTAIADNIRSYTGKTEKLSLDDMAESIEKVYKKGQDSGGGEYIQVELTADEFEVGTLEGATGKDYPATNRARTGYIDCTSAPSYKVTVSINCDLSVKWLVHFFNNGTRIGKTNFASTNCENVLNLCSSPNEVTHIRIVLAYVNDATVTNIDDLFGIFTIIKSTIAKTYEDGIQEEYDRFWDTYQRGYSDGSFAFAGRGWNIETFKPKKNIDFTNNYMLFRDSYIDGDLVEILNNLGITFSTARADSLYMAFYNTKFTRIGEIDTTKSSVNQSLFEKSSKLETIDKIIVAGFKGCSNAFTNCTALKNITFEGTIGNSISFASSPLLTTESIDSIINALQDLTGATSKTLTVHADVYDGMVASGKDALVTAKNWALAKAQ
jgi:hypothetical protein